MSVVVTVLLITCYPGFILRHRFLKPPARTQTPLAAFGGAHGRPAHLDIAVGSVLRLAECPSGRGERSLPLPAKSLASVARQSNPCPEPINH